MAPRYLAALFGFVWFMHLGGWHALNPTDIGWILSGDWLQHWLGWMFFRHEPWTFPLGAISALPYPIGSNIGFTDSNPLLSLVLKPFSNQLPSEFQFMGPWLAFCFVMQGYMGAALTSTVTKHAGQQWLGGCLFVLSPVLVGRLGHDTLCAHWLLLGLMYLGLKDYADARSARRGAWLAMGAVLLAALTHPYLAAMSFLLAQVAFVRMWRSRLATGRQTAIAALTTTAAMVAIFGAIGYFGSAEIGAGGWGLFAADLVAFINPAGYSRLLPSFDLPGGEWEGQGFLGLGGLVAIAIAIVAWRRLRPTLRTGTKVILAACLLMGFYALSENVHLVGDQVARMHKLYKWFPFITSPFRASGRFIWPLHYLALLFGIWGTTRILKASRAAAGTALLAATVILQAADLKTAPGMLATKPFSQVPHAAFEPAAGHFRHLALVPMQVQGACVDNYQENHVYRFMLEAARLHLTYNSGNFARLSMQRVQAECLLLDQQVEAGRLDPETIYVVSEDHVIQFTKAGAACHRMDGDVVCVSRDSHEGFRTYLETGRVK